MSQMIALGQTVYVTCSQCGRHAWRVSVIPGIQKLTCPCCERLTRVEFYVDRNAACGPLFKMDVRPTCWS
jgi:hypothetical protein